MTSLNFITAGESHGSALLAILEGLPAGLHLSEKMINKDLARRQRGFGSGERMKIEQDQCEILTGVMAGKTNGAPLGIKIPNRDHSHWQGKPIQPRTIPRPGHVDLVGAVKYGFNDLRPGLERASARETAARVAIGAACKQFLAQFEIHVGGYVSAISTITADLNHIQLEERPALAEQHSTRCPDPNIAREMQAAIKRASEEGESMGGIIEVVGLNIPPGLGSHVHWDRKLDGRLAQAVMSIPAIKGVEIGPAFTNTQQPGSAVQDPIIRENNRIMRSQNAAGGLEGGISNGQTLMIRAAMKPIPTTRKPQKSVDLSNGQAHEIIYERSDVCPVPRAVVVVEAMVAFILVQALLEKIGGDHMAEVEARFKQLSGLGLSELQMVKEEKVWWE